jgi:thiamine kinase-like enzyme
MIDSVVAALNQRRRVHKLSLLQRFSAGEQGAYLVADLHGRRSVLKWRPGTESLDQLRFARTATTQLRLQHYPAPTYHTIGTELGGVYWLQTVLPGQPMLQLQPPFLSSLLALHDLHREHASATSPEVWPEEVIRTVLVGGDGYCLHQSLRDHSAATRELLHALQALVTTYRSAIPPRHDLVHFDFQPANVLVEGETITGVVDWDGVRVGDAAFDLATLLFYAYDEQPMRAALWERGLALTTPGAFAVYLAHLILRQVDWSLRLHGTPVAARYIARGQQILHELSARVGMASAVDST